MRTVRLPLLRGALFLIALAAIAFIMARGDNPAQATTYNPALSVSVSDSSPGAAADIKIDFSLDAPDSFPNVRTNSSIQFLPRQWGIHVPETEEEELARIGGIAGTFNAFTTLGLGGNCNFSLPVPFTMIEANPRTGYDPATGTYDPQKLTSALETGPLAGHPGGIGYDGQFVNDPATRQTPGDLGLPLINFNADEMHTTQGGSPGPYVADQWAYRNLDGLSSDGRYPRVSVGDIRLTPYKPVGQVAHAAGTVVQAGDGDLWSTAIDGKNTEGNVLYNFRAYEKHSDLDSNTQMDPEAGEGIYQDLTADESGNYGTVSYGDMRMFVFSTTMTSEPRATVVEDLYLQGGITRYPDFLNQIFPPDVVGDPLARMFGATNVLDVTAASVNIVTYRPGQLPGYPATLGYPNVVIVLDPVAPIDIVSIEITSDLCSPLSLTSTNLGVSKDNLQTTKNEGGYVRLTNPRSEKSHDFTLVTTSQPDADDDGIENMLDSCPLTPNTGDLDGRDHWIFGGLFSTDPDVDGLDSSCDPDPNNQGPINPVIFTPDEDLDNYTNRADNCSTVPNGIEVLGVTYQRVSNFTFWWGITGDNIPPGGTNQIDSDGDDIGDACDPDPYAITGHMHVVTLTQGVPIAKHGVKLDDLDGPESVALGGSATYNLSVENKSDSAEDAVVGLRVVEGCGDVSGPSTVHVNGDASANANFTVDFGGCDAGEYTVQADACHAGDPAPAGLFGVGDCPGASDGLADTNTLDDAPRSITVVVGSP